MKKTLAQCGRYMFLSVYLAFCGSSAQLLAEDTPEVAAFKNYMSSGPAVQSLRYREVLNNGTLGDSYVAADFNGNYFFRQVVAGDNPDAPICRTNRCQSPMFIGQLGSMRWQIAGFKLTRSYDPNLEHPDSYATFADGARLVLNEVLALGPQHVQRGTAVWQGDSFKIRPSSFVRQIDKKAPEFFNGTITVEKGLVVKMSVARCGTFLYTYNKSAKLPPGIPYEIIWPAEGGGFDHKVRIEELHLGPAVNEAVFNPTNYISPDVAINSIWSNSVQIVKAELGDAQVKLIVPADPRQVRDNVQKVQTRRKYVLAFLVASAFAFALYLLLATRARRGAS